MPGGLSTAPSGAPRQKASGSTSHNHLSDGRRMYLQIDTSGSKYWRMNYRFAGKDKALALGVSSRP